MLLPKKPLSLFRDIELLDTPLNGPVWIVDDDEVRASLAFALSPKFETHTFSSAQEFLSKTSLDCAGCLILETQINGANSFDIQQELNQRVSPIAVIFLSRRASISMVVKAMQNGAVSFLEKPVDPDLLSQTVEKALRESQRRLKRLRLCQLLGTLSTREREIFDLVEQGFRNSDIASKLFLSERTVEVHRAHITRKLGNGAPIRLLYELCRTNGDLELLPSKNSHPKRFQR